MTIKTIIEPPSPVANIPNDPGFMFGWDKYCAWVLLNSTRDWEERQIRESFEVEPE